MASPAFNLDRTDIQKWLRNTLIFSSPALLSFLIAFQSGHDFHLAFGMAEQAILAALIDIVAKFIKDNGSKEAEKPTV